MVWLDYLTTVSSVATAGGVFLAWWQLRATKQQAQSAFEDSLTAQYREIVHSLPLSAMLGETLTNEELQTALPTFYRYFDLCNEQIFLRSKSRIRPDTWEEWTEGIKQNLARPAFRAAWAQIDARSDGSFDELRGLIAEIGLPAETRRTPASVGGESSPAFRIRHGHE